MQSISDFAYWEQRYQEKTTRWDLGQAAPAFVSLLRKTYPNLVKPDLVFSSRFIQGSRLLLVHGRQFRKSLAYS